MPNDESNKAEYRNESDELQENQRNSLKAEANLSITVLDYQQEYPDDDAAFCGLYGFYTTFINCNFLGR